MDIISVSPLFFLLTTNLEGADSTAMTTGEWLQMWDESMAGTGKKRCEQPVAAIPKLNDSDSFFGNSENAYPCELTELLLGAVSSSI